MNGRQTMTSQPKTRWLRFSLRAAFIVVTLLCVLLGMRYRERPYSDAYARRVAERCEGLVTRARPLSRQRVFDALRISEQKVSMHAWGGNVFSFFEVGRLSPGYDLHLVLVHSPGGQEKGEVVFASVRNRNTHPTTLQDMNALQRRKSGP